MMRTQIFNFLKTHGHSTLRDIADAFPKIHNDQVIAELGKLVDEGLLKVSCSGKYRISAFIDAWNPEERKQGIYDYQLIQETISEVPAQSLPAKWINPNAYKIARRDQGDRGTCVGQSAAYAFDLNMMKLTSWTPDLTQTKRNLVIAVGESKILKDELPEGSASAESIYHLSRELGNVKNPSGSYVEFAAKAWNKLGICFEQNWWTSKTPLFGNKTAYPTSRDVCLPEASQHVISGYSTTQDFDTIKRAIYNNGFVLMPIAIYENWTANNKEGLFPDPKGEPIGSHALCWVGYDENNLYCLHSWAEWSMLGGISREYFARNPMMAYVPLDESEIAYAKDIYCKLEITTNEPCDITIGRDTFKATTSAKGAYVKESKILIVATPISPSGLVPASITREIILSQDVVLPLSFERREVIIPPVVQPTRDLFACILDCIRNLFIRKN